MDRSSAMSLSARRRSRRIIAVSLWWSWKLGWVRNADVRTAPAGIADPAAARRDSAVAAAPPTTDATAASRSSTVRSVDVSSRLTATVSASTGHTLMSCRSAAATICVRSTRCVKTHGVEELLGLQRYAEPAQPGGERRRTGVDSLGDGDESRRPVVLRVERRDHGEQHLRGADVARGALAADVLLTGLQREPVRRLAVGVDADPDEPARQRALQSLAHRHEAGVRAAEADRHAEALRRSHGHVGAPLARWHEQGQREQVGRGDDERAGVVRARRRGHAGRVPLPRTPGSCTSTPKPASSGRGAVTSNGDELDPQRLGAGLQHRQRLRVGVGVDEEPGRRGPAGPPAQRHRLGRGGRLVEQAGAGDRQAGEVGDDGLEPRAAPRAGPG